jgi:hypothetical protein
VKQLVASAVNTQAPVGDLVSEFVDLFLRDQKARSLAPKLRSMPARDSSILSPHLSARRIRLHAGRWESFGSSGHSSRARIPPRIKKLPQNF